MKRQAVFTIAMLSLSTTFVVMPVFAKTVQNLDQIKPELKTKDGKSLFDKEMDGYVAPDNFGAIATSDITTAHDLTQLIYRHSPFTPDTAPQWGLIGSKNWSLGSAMYPTAQNVAVVSLCHSDKAVNSYFNEESKKFADCEKWSNINHVALAVVSKDMQGKYRLLAKPYSETFDFENMDKTAIAKSAFAVASREEDLVIGSLDRLDMANYRLNATTPAFGVRYSTSVGYAGGGASNQGMTLFAVINGELKPVLAIPLIYQYENLAGEWHKDGTREHDISESNGIIKISSHSTAGFADIILHTKGEKDKTFVWNPTSQRYE